MLLAKLAHAVMHTMAPPVTGDTRQPATDLDIAHGHVAHAGRHY
jgi:hypothetical protein